MSDVDGLSSYVLTLGLLTVFVLIWMARQHKTKQDALIWLTSGIVGVLLGAAGALAAASALGYQVKKPEPKAVAENNPTTAPMMGGMGGGAPGPGGGGMGGGGMGGGGGGMGGGMMGGIGGGPRPKQQLTTLVRKLELLTGDIALTLTAEQRQAIAKQLDEFSELKTLTDDEADARYKDLLGLLDDQQKSKPDAVGLPRGGFGGGGFGGAPPAPDANPFESEANATSLKTLRERLNAK